MDEKTLKYSDDVCKVCNLRDISLKCVGCRKDVCSGCVYFAPWYDTSGLAAFEHGKCYGCLKWKQNDKRCEVCLQQFGMMLLRHHCRQCGSNVCGYCSIFRLAKNQYTGLVAKTRVCNFH